VKLYEIILKPQSGFATPLKGDTLFGCFCWQAALDKEILDGGLDRWVSCYGERPAVVFSSAWPCFAEAKGNTYALKRPELPPSMLFADQGKSLKERMLARKDNQKKRWMLTSAPLAINLGHTTFLDDGELSRKALSHLSAEKSKQMKHAAPMFSREAERMYNSINRLTMTTGEGFAPFGSSATHYYPETELVVFALIDEEATGIERVRLALKRIGQSGFGADASTGSGRFQLGKSEELPLPTCAGANAAYCLAPVVPQPGVFAGQFFRPFVRFGRHGDRLAAGAAPFKNPVVMADEGAVFIPRGAGSLQKPYIGRAVTGISKAMPQTIHQGYAIHIPFKLEMDHV